MNLFIQTGERIHELNHLPRTSNQAAQVKSKREVGLGPVNPVHGRLQVPAVLENQEGKGPSQIFEEAGFDLTMIGRMKAKSGLEHWRKTYHTYGTEGLLTERRGKSNAVGGPNSIERRLTKATQDHRTVPNRLEPSVAWKGFRDGHNLSPDTKGTERLSLVCEGRGDT